MNINCPKDNEATQYVRVNGIGYICCIKCHSYFKVEVTEYDAHTGAAVKEDALLGDNGPDDPYRDMLSMPTDLTISPSSPSS